MRIIIATQCVNIGYLLLYLVCENDGYNERERERESGSYCARGNNT